MNIMSHILSNLWFAVIPLGLLNVVFLYLRARKHLSHDPQLKRSARKAVLYLAITMGVTASTVGVIQIFGDFNNPFFIYSSNLSDPYVLAGKIVMYLFWVCVLAWAWFTDGLISYAKLLFLSVSKFQHQFLKLAATAVCAGGILVLTFYNGSAIAVVINNHNEQSVEWVKVSFEGGESRLESIESLSRVMTSIKPSKAGEVEVIYKLSDKKNPYKATMPFELSDLPMGYFEVVVTQDGKISVRDHLIFK